MIFVFSVGKNPLPVAVAGLYFRAQASYIYLVGSHETKEECCRIKVLWTEHGFTPKVHKIFISREPDLANANELQKLPKLGIHFHYSGGTAAMAMAISKALPGAEMSYLSLYSNQIFGDSEEFPSTDLRLYPRTSLTLTQLIRLRGFCECTHCDHRAIVPLTNRLTSLSERAQEWEPQVLNRTPKDPRPGGKFNYKRTSDSQLPPGTFCTNNIDIAAAFNTALGPSTFTLAPDGSWRAILSPATSDFWDLISFFRKGATFEFKVQLALEAALAQSIWRPAPVFRSLYFGRHEDVAAEKLLFEADLLTVLGYQLLYISCTTDGSLAKTKAFEAFHRARQLGGDGARALVIAGLFEHDRDGDDSTLLHLEIGLPERDRSLDIKRIDASRATVASLTDTLRDYLRTLLPENA